MKRLKILPETEEIMPLLVQAWRKLMRTPGPKDHLMTREFRSVVDRVKDLQENRVKLQDEKSALGAYLLYDWPIHYLEAFSILGELPFIPKRVLDIGSGAAPMAFAALKRGAAEVFATDLHAGPLELGAEITGRSGFPLTIRKWDASSSPCPVDGPFDLIMIGYALFEIFDSERERFAFIEKQLRRLTPHGFLVLIDSSQKEQNDVIMRLRDLAVENGVPVQAPCVWKGKCPALASSAPCYAQRTFDKPYLIKEIQRSGKINLNSLKMSYLVLKHPDAGWPSLPKEKYYRVISPPFVKMQGKHYYLCGTDGKKKLFSDADENTKSGMTFKYLRRGELISVEDCQEMHDGLKITQNSKIAIEAACGKAIPEQGETDEKRAGKPLA